MLLLLQLLLLRTNMQHLIAGVKLLGMGASFKKVEIIKSNLRVIAQHKDTVKEQQRLLDMDPNLFVIIPGVTVPVAAST
jgi:hypothetical protein